jgi:hypothetical protein
MISGKAPSPEKKATAFFSGDGALPEIISHPHSGDSLEKMRGVC